MQKIFKYPIKITDIQTIWMPQFALILDVQVQAGVPCLWAMVAENAVPEKRVIEIIGTGNPIDPGQRMYIGTFQDVPFVWHVFEYFAPSPNETSIPI